MFIPTPQAEAQDPVARYEQIRTIKIGGDGGWNFLEVDAANRMLYVTRGNARPAPWETASRLLALPAGDFRRQCPILEPLCDYYLEEQPIIVRADVAGGYATAESWAVATE